MNIELFKHEVLGTMHIFGNENGLWFSYDDIINCLEVEEYRADKKYKFLKPELKCMIADYDLYGFGKGNYKFIHEKALYQFMCLGSSTCCQDFQEWVGEIAWTMDYLNLNYDSSYMRNSRLVNDYEFIKNYVTNINDTTPIGQTAKEVMTRLDDEMKNAILSETMKPIITDKSYRNDYTLKEAYKDPFYDPSLSKEDIEEKRLESNMFGTVIKNDELKEKILKAYDEDRLMDFTIEEEIPKLKKRKNVTYKKQNIKSSCPSWLRNVVK